MQLFLPGALVSPMRHVSLAWKCAMVTCVVFSEQKHATQMKKIKNNDQGQSFVDFEGLKTL